MLNKLIELVRENAGDLITNNENITPENKEQAIVECAQTIITNLKKVFSSGNIAGLTELIKSNNITADNKIVSDIITTLSATYTTKLSIDETEAKRISTHLIPTVLTQLISKTNNPNDNTFDVQTILKEIGGGGLAGMLGGFFKF
ncbi:MAG: hypothetical protein V4643_07115 [Bacteroidota bacterium]